MATSKGVQTNAVYGFISSLLNTIKELAPQYVLVASETGPSFRKEQFEDYKATRTWRKKHPDEAEELDKQADCVQKILKTMGIPVLNIPKYEADDVVGALSKKYADSGIEVNIVSNDMDMLQLVNNFVKVYRKKFYTKDEVLKDFGFGPEKIADYKALRGDPSDNIPGVYGIGEITAKRLIKEYGNVENVYKHINLISPISLRNKLIAGKESAFMSKGLSLIKSDIPIDVSLKDAEVKDFNNESVKKIFEEYEFKSLIKKVFPEQKESADKSQIGLGI